YMVTNAAAADLLEPRDEACLWQQALESLTAGRPVTRPMQLSEGSTITARCTPIMTGAHPVGALIEVAAAAPRTAERRPRNRGQGGRLPRQSRATARFERELAEAARGPDRTVLLEGEQGSGRLFAARRIHQLRGHDTPLIVHPAGMAQAQSGERWLADLARLLADGAVTIAVTDLDLLDERTQRGLADVLAGHAGTPLVLMTGQTAEDEPGCWAAARVRSDVTVHVPALRQRREDIPELAHSILRASGVTSRVGYRAMTALTNHAWPGNVSQLKRVLARAARVAGGTDIRLEHLGRDIYISTRGRQTLTRLEALERDAIVEALRECRGNRIQAAAALGMSRSTLYRRLRAFGLEPGRTVL
ncbi:MAG: helix-turn-helix domain-containing protein, partial [Streptosporangiaceae bacterium]